MSSDDQQQIYTKPSFNLHRIDDWESTQGDFARLLSQGASGADGNEVVSIILADQLKLKRGVWTERVKAFLYRTGRQARDWYRDHASPSGHHHFGGTLATPNVIFITNHPTTMNRMYSIHSYHIVQLPPTEDEITKFLDGLGVATKLTQLRQPKVQIALHMYVDPGDAEGLKVLARWMLANSMKPIMPMWLRLGSQEEEDTLGNEEDFATSSYAASMAEPSQHLPPFFDIMKRYLEEEDLVRVVDEYNDYLVDDVPERFERRRHPIVSCPELWEELRGGMNGTLLRRLFGQPLSEEERLSRTVESKRQHRPRSAERDVSPPPPPRTHSADNGSRRSSGHGSRRERHASPKQTSLPARGEGRTRSSDEEPVVSLPTYLKECARSKGLEIVQGADMMLAWRLAGHNETTLMDLVRREAHPPSKNNLTLLLMKQLAQVPQYDIPESVDVSDMVEATANYFLEFEEEGKGRRKGRDGATKEETRRNRNTPNSASHSKRRGTPEREMQRRGSPQRSPRRRTRTPPPDRGGGGATSSSRNGEAVVRTAPRKKASPKKKAQVKNSVRSDNGGSGRRTHNVSHHHNTMDTRSRGEADFTVSRRIDHRRSPSPLRFDLRSGNDDYGRSLYDSRGRSRSPPRRSLTRSPPPMLASSGHYPIGTSREMISPRLSGSPPFQSARGFLEDTRERWQEFPGRDSRQSQYDRMPLPVPAATAPRLEPMWDRREFDYSENSRRNYGGGGGGGGGTRWSDPLLPPHLPVPSLIPSATLRPAPRVVPQPVPKPHDPHQDWEPFQQFLLKKMSSFNQIYGVPSSNLTPVADVIKKLMVHSGLDRETLRRWFHIYGGEYVQERVRSSLEPFKDCLSAGVTVGYIVALVSEYLALN